MPGSVLVLPYSVENSGRKSRFTDNMEVATLVCIAEAERKKKSGFLRGSEETLTFLSKLHYPFWAVPWEDGCLLIDGMNILSSNILHFKTPNVEDFIEHLKRSTTVHELFHSTLRSHNRTFSEFISQIEISFEGLINDKEMLADMLNFLKDCKSLTHRSIPDSTSTIEPKISEKDVIMIKEKVVGHSSMLQSEIKALNFAIDTANEETKKHISKLRRELEQIREKFESEISQARIKFEKKKGELEEELTVKIEKITITQGKEQDIKISEKRKWEQELLRLEQSKSEYEKRKELRKRKNDQVGEARWETRLRDVENRISTVKGKIRALSDFIKQSNKEAEKATKKVQESYRKLIDEERKKITDLESSRDSDLTTKEKEIAEIQQETLDITDKIERLIDQKRERVAALKQNIIEWKIDAATLIYVPFYLLQYKTEKEKRYILRTPAIARGHGGLVVKIRKAFGRYSTLLKPRSKALEKLLASLKEKLETDRKTQSDLENLGVLHDITKSAGFEEKMKKGLDELEVEGWIKPEEKQTILNAYVKD